MNDLNQLTDQQRQWLAHIEAAQQSHLSLADYARTQGLPPQSLYQWRNVFKQKGIGPGSSRKASAFAQVQVTATTLTEPAEGNLRLKLGRELTLECNQWPEPAWLAQLIQLLDQEAGA
jgi:transposase-like protein